MLLLPKIIQFRAILALLANQAGNLINYNNLAADSRTYFKQIRHYLSVLEETFIIIGLHKSHFFGSVSFSEI
jgi:predicted AAA+ superfamily ATPase